MKEEIGNNGTGERNKEEVEDEGMRKRRREKRKMWRKKIKK